MTGRRLIRTRPKEKGEVSLSHRSLRQQVDSFSKSGRSALQKCSTWRAAGMSGGAAAAGHGSRDDSLQLQDGADAGLFFYHVLLITEPERASERPTQVPERRLLIGNPMCAVSFAPPGLPCQHTTRQPALLLGIERFSASSASLSAGAKFSPLGYAKQSSLAAFGNILGRVLMPRGTLFAMLQM